jgi:hypothetical protein
MFSNSPSRKEEKTSLMENKIKCQTLTFKRFQVRYLRENQKPYTLHASMLLGYM